MKTRILVVEDDKSLLAGLVDLLTSEGYNVFPSATGEEAVPTYRKEKPDLMIVDLMLPGKSGYDICREIRKTDGKTPVIMLTAKSQEVDKIAGFSVGADDYVTKPFHMMELLARVRAVLRRTKPSPEAATGASWNGVVADPGTLTLSGKGKTVEVSDKEFSLFCLFANSPGNILRRENLLETVWGITYAGTTRTLDQYITKLRKKLQSLGHPSALETVHGVGYRLIKSE